MTNLINMKRKIYFAVIFVIFLISCQPSQRKTINSIKEMELSKIYGYINSYNCDTLNLKFRVAALDSALKIIDKLIILDKNDNRFYNMKLNILITKKEYSQIYTLLMNKNYPKSYNEIEYIYKAICLIQLGDNEKAHSYLSIADSLIENKLKNYPDSIDIQINHVYYSFIRHNYDSAERLLDLYCLKDSNSTRLKGFKYNFENFYDSNETYFGP